MIPRSVGLFQALHFPRFSQEALSGPDCVAHCHLSKPRPETESQCVCVCIYIYINIYLVFCFCLLFLFVDGGGGNGVKWRVLEYSEEGEGCRKYK